MKQKEDAVLVALAAPVIESRVDDYAELVDEADPTGPVQLCRQDGTIIAIMSRRAWDYFRGNRA